MYKVGGLRRRLDWIFTYTSKLCNAGHDFEDFFSSWSLDPLTEFETRFGGMFWRCIMIVD